MIDLQQEARRQREALTAIRRIAGMHLAKYAGARETIANLAGYALAPDPEPHPRDYLEWMRAITRDECATCGTHDQHAIWCQAPDMQSVRYIHEDDFEQAQDALRRQLAGADVRIMRLLEARTG